MAKSLLQSSSHNKARAYLVIYLQMHLNLDQLIEILKCSNLVDFRRS